MYPGLGPLEWLYAVDKHTSNRHYTLAIGCLHTRAQTPRLPLLIRTETSPASDTRNGPYRRQWLKYGVNIKSQQFHKLTLAAWVLQRLFHVRHMYSITFHELLDNPQWKGTYTPQRLTAQISWPSPDPRLRPGDGGISLADEYGALWLRNRLRLPDVSRRLFTQWKLGYAQSIGTRLPLSPARDFHRLYESLATYLSYCIHGRTPRQFLWAAGAHRTWLHDLIMW